jgi:hypothetical protein
MPGVAYVTVPEFKVWVGLGDTIDDVIITDALLAASRGVDNFCKTQFWQTAAGTVRLFDTCSTSWLRTGDVVTVTELATDKNRDGVYETVWTAADYQLFPLNPAAAPELRPFTDIHAIGTLTFPQPSGGSSRYGLIRVTGTWGWPAVPEPVVQSTLLVANRLLKRRNSPEGVAGFDEFGVVRISSRDDPDAVRYLTPYRTNRRAGGWPFA